MVLGHQVEEIIEQQIRLIFGDSVDSFREALVNVHRLPASYGCGKSVLRM